MALDIRLPIGLMFSIFGIILSVYGLATGSDTEMYQASLGLNINFIWGIVLFVFGALMLAFAVRERLTKPKQTDTEKK